MELEAPKAEPEGGGCCQTTGDGPAQTALLAWLVIAFAWRRRPRPGGVTDR